jgi:hypothetical protein
MLLVGAMPIKKPRLKLRFMGESAPKYQCLLNDINLLKNHRCSHIGFGTSQRYRYSVIISTVVVRGTPQLFGRLFLIRLYNILVLPPQPAGCAPCIGAAFASLKKYAAHFFNPAVGGTEPKKAANPVTGLEFE